MIGDNWLPCVCMLRHRKLPQLYKTNCASAAGTSSRLVVAAFPHILLHTWCGSQAAPRLTQSSSTLAAAAPSPTWHSLPQYSTLWQGLQRRSPLYSSPQLAQGRASGPCGVTISMCWLARAGCGRSSSPSSCGCSSRRTSGLAMLRLLLLLLLLLPGCCAAVSRARSRRTCDIGGTTAPAACQHTVLVIHVQSRCQVTQPCYVCSSRFGRGCSALHGARPEAVR
jgi:hypothetical protein